MPDRNQKENAGFQLNPFAGDDDFAGIDPKDMSLKELKLFIHVKKLKVRLEFERLQSSVNYTSMLIDAFEQFGGKEWLLKFIESAAGLEKPEE
ncbi:hypothetical protein CH373_07580 [Leptospira perolatii]|uniref:Uncharacterized protein n=1 Tax=Leptospira perolatii TaxID=2023191 RepID=A0A2M9ZPM5_9LEPT|nr:hypothetical protein [Leptospira perolatii]PJZ70767.1 hypothetical protein CH360_04440 [Leptospira perolatii]PJZ73975.1 hypothetical protein CH373_07580 [Leptospira perolatii]